MPKRGHHAKKKPPTKREPLLVAAVAVVIAWLTLKLGVPIDDNTADAIAGVLVPMAVLWVRGRVTPVAAPTLPAEAVPELEVTGLDTVQTQALLRSKGLSS